MERVQVELAQVSDDGRREPGASCPRHRHRHRLREGTGHTPHTLTHSHPTTAQLSEAMTTLPELRLLATDPFVPTLVRKKVFQRLLEDSEKVKVSEISKRLLGGLWGLGTWGRERPCAVLAAALAPPNPTHAR